MTHGDDRPDNNSGRSNDSDHRRPPPDGFRDEDRGHPRYDREPPNTMGRGRGLGYRAQAPLNRDYWERRDRPREDDVTFVRGETIRRDDDDNNRMEMNMPPAGRGRGRGRGVNNRPAWMDSEGPIGAATADNVKEDKKDETLELLLAQARQVQQEQLSKKNTRTVIKEDVNNHKNKAETEKNKEKDNIKRLEMEKQRRLEEEKKALEEERRRLELEREAEEQRQLLALVGDDMEVDNTSKKRQYDSEDEIFEFETEEEREERLARQRRERRKKLKVLDVGDKVDLPRNSAGVIASEMKNMPAVTSLQNNTNSDQNYEVAPKQVDSDDSFDIFAADNPTPIPTQSKNGSTRNATTISKSNIAQECDDIEGYYKASIGEIITVPKYRGSNDAAADKDENGVARFRVLGIIGKGVFSTVIKVVEEINDSNQVAGREMAMKVIRNNEVMAKAAAKEMRILRMLCRPRDKKKKEDDGKDNSQDDQEEKERERENHNIVRLLEVDPTFMAKDSSSYAIPPPEFRSHCIFLFEFLPYNLREVLSKFGKNVGITLSAVRSYARQLLCALGHLERHRIVHADLKPDNILVSANFSTVKLADFGSAFFETDHDNDPTPYLVSRFYRPPEVILGLEYDRMVDLWSTSVTLAELFTGSVLFPGISNNDILMKFMDTLGPFSHKMVRRHAASYTKMG